MSSTDVIRQAIDVRRFPWIRPLVGAYASDFTSVAPLFAGDPSDPAAWRQTIARVSGAKRDHAALSGLLIRQLERRSAPTAARAAAAKFSDARSVAVVTGQQAGLFGGPLYTLLKAVTTIQLARRIESEHGVPAVPVFWVECEDHDWAEVRSAHVLDADCALQDIVMDDVDGAGVRPVAALVLDEGVLGAIEALDALLPASEFRAELLKELRATYTPGAGMATAFASWLDRLLGPHGLVVYEANDAGAKPLVADLFSAELRDPARTAALVHDAGAVMQKLGHTPQVESSADGTALFYMDASGRRPIKRRGADFAIGDMTRPASDLVAEALSRPERFSPNVVLRPLVQDRIFPTACYVGGPSELAYQAQLAGVYRAFGVEPPLLFSRASVTLLDSGAAKFLERHDMAFESLHAQDESALNHLLATLMPPAVERSLEEASREIVSRLAAVQAAVPAVDPTLAGAAETTRDRMLESLKTLQNKIVQASKRKDDTLRRQFQRTRALAFPGGHPQERAVNLTFFVNRYGFGLVQQLLDVLPLDGGKHFVITI